MKLRLYYDYIMKQLYFVMVFSFPTLFFAAVIPLSPPCCHNSVGDVIVLGI